MQKNSLSRFERGEQFPSQKNLEKMLALYGKPDKLDYFLGLIQREKERRAVEREAPTIHAIIASKRRIEAFLGSGLSPELYEWASKGLRVIATTLKQNQHA